MIGSIFLLAVLWVVIALGVTNKGDKFWSINLLIPTVFVVFVGGVALFDNSPESELTVKELGRIVLALSIGLTAVVAGRKEFEKKMWPVAAGITHLLVGFGWAVLIMGIVRKLNG